MKIRKRLLVSLLLITAMLAATLITGCSQSEQDLLQLLNEISSLPRYESTGTVHFSLKGLPSPETSNPVESLLYNALQKGITINCTGKADMEKEIMDYTLSYVNEATGREQEITRIICKGNTIYIKLDELVNFLAPISSTQVSKKLQEVFGDAQYLSITTEEYYQSLGITEKLKQQMSMFYPNSFMSTDLVKLYQKLMLTLPKAYENFSSGIVQKNGDTYTFQLSGEEAVELFGSAFKYSLNNLPALENWLNSFINNLSEDEMAILGLDPQKIEGYQELINMFISNMAQNKEQILEELDPIMSELTQNQEFKKILDGFNLQYRVGKNSAGTYTNACEFSMNFEDYGTLIGMEMSVDNKIKKTAPFDVTLPTSHIMTYTELLNKVTKTMWIQVDSNIYTLTDAQGSSQGFIAVQNVENYTYLPMRQIAELFGETVGWDAANNQAYVMKDGVKIDMTGIIINNLTYVKIRDFTKLGYEVDWDNDTRTVIITKSSL